MCYTGSAEGTHSLDKMITPEWPLPALPETPGGQQHDFRDESLIDDAPSTYPFDAEFPQPGFVPVLEFGIPDVDVDMAPADDEMVPVREAAEAIGIATRNVRRLVSKGFVRSQKRPVPHTQRLL